MFGTIILLVGNVRENIHVHLCAMINLNLAENVSCVFGENTSTLYFKMSCVFCFNTSTCRLQEDGDLLQAVIFFT